MKQNCKTCGTEMLYGGPMVFASSPESAKGLLSMDPGPCPECGDGVSHGKKLNADGTVRTNWFCEPCKIQTHVHVPFNEWWAFSQEPDPDNEPSLPKEEALEEVFAEIRGRKRIPWVNPEESDEEQITVDEICLHGKSWYSLYLLKDESGLWKCDDGDEGDELCSACEPDCDCGKPHQHSCPICKAPWPEYSEERLIEAWKNREDLVHSTNCPKCGHAWTLSMEEMEKLHPEVLAEMEEGPGRTYEPHKRRPTPAPEAPKTRPIRNGRPIGRNSECPCGSGKKYKRCCEGKA